MRLCTTYVCTCALAERHRQRCGVRGVRPWPRQGGGRLPQGGGGHAAGTRPGAHARTQQRLLQRVVLLACLTICCCSSRSTFDHDFIWPTCFWNCCICHAWLRPSVCWTPAPCCCVWYFNLLKHLSRLGMDLRSSAPPPPSKLSHSQTVLPIGLYFSARILSA